MDVESLAKQLILQNMTPEQQNAVLESVRSTLQEARANQKRRVSENVGMVVDALSKIEADIRARYDDLGQKITDRVNSIRDGRDGIDGRDGKDGKDGRPGRDGVQGPMGPAGRDGRDGVDGVDGVSVTDAKIDFDGSLVISLSNGREINVGEVVAPDLAERIKVITNGGGTSQEVLDTLASLQAQIDALVILDYKGTWNASTNTPTLASGVGDPGSYYIVSVAGSTNLDGITDWQPGDWAIFNGTEWQKIDQSWATAGANNNITSMTGLTGGISSPDFVQFDTAPATTPTTAGALYWNTADGAKTLDLVMEGGNVVQQIGEEIYFRIKASSAVTNGQTVMFTGTVGASGALLGAPASGLTADTAAYFMGVATEDIPLNGWGYVTQFGVVRGLDTSGGVEAWVDGEILYYDPTTPGGLSKFVPVAPAAKIQVASVLRAASVNGSLFVRPTIRTKLENLNDVETSGAATNDILQYTAGGFWEHMPPGNLNGVGSLANALTIGTGLSGTSYDGSSAVTIANTGVLSLAGTADEVEVSASTGAVTISLPATINANTTGNAANVTGTVAVANGGTGQTTKTEAFDALAPTTTKGDLIVSDGSDNVRLPVGADNYVLTADSTQASGVKWSAGGGGMADPGANGIVVRTAVNTTTARTITAGTGVSVSNGDGVSGNPTITNSGVTSITGTASQITASASTGGVTLSLPATINVNTSGTAANVTGTVAIANGGTGQTSKVAAFDALSPTTTKGDLIVYNGTDNVRLPVGIDAYILTADSTQSSGVKWTAAPNTGMADPGANGIVVRTALNTTTSRTITAGTGISISNGNGVSGNPTITNSGVTSVNGSTGAVTVNASVNADAAYGNVGTYVFAAILNTGGIVEGSTYAGSSLYPAGIHTSSTALATDTGATSANLTNGSATLSGTWRAMGRSNASTSSRYRGSLFLRIS